MNGRVLLVRHGETTANVARLLDTALPGAELTDNGYAQADNLRERLRASAPVEIWHSEAIRAGQTAAALQPLVATAPLRREGIYETQVGALEGRGDAEAMAAFAQTYRAWLGGSLERRFPEGESAHNVLDRFVPVVEAAAETVAGQADSSIVIVSHAAAIRLAAFRLAGLSPDYVYNNHLHNTAVVELRRGEGAAGWECLSWGGAPEAPR